MLFSYDHAVQDESKNIKKKTIPFVLIFFIFSYLTDVYFSLEV